MHNRRQFHVPCPKQWGIPAAFVAVLAVLGAGLSAAPVAEAHALRVFATVDGDQITGYAYWVGGERLSEATVRVLDADGELLGEAQTDAEGEFHYHPEARQDHVLEIALPDGHRGTFTVAAAELPGTLPPGPDEENAAQDDEETDAGEAETAAAMDEDALRPLLQDTVSQPIRQLREDLDALSEQRRVQDILGGMGYIVGVFGIMAFARQWFGGRKKS
ncbi:MAG: hypothetical protein ACLFV4_10745 [Candidatus Hydrogenedentota bacterium]